MPVTSAGSDDWAAIYAEHGHAMRLAARGVIGGPATADKALLGKSADEIVGDVIIELMGKPLPITRNLRGFLTTVVRRRAIDVTRRTKRELPVGLDLDDKDRKTHTTDGDLRETLRRDMLGGAAAAALDELPPRERHAIEQRVMLQRQAKDVALELGVSPQRVSQLVNAGVARLRKLPAFTQHLPADHPLRAPSATMGPDPTGTPS